MTVQTKSSEQLLYPCVQMFHAFHRYVSRAYKPGLIQSSNSVSGRALQWHNEFSAAMVEEEGIALDALEGLNFLPGDWSDTYPGTSHSPMSLLETGGPIALSSSKGNHLYRQGRASFGDKPCLLDCLLGHRFKDATDP